MIKERRKYIRVNTALKFNYRVKDSSGTEREALTKNISPGGINASVNKAIKKGDWLELAIYLPGSGQPIIAAAKVIWTADEKAGKIDVGIKFEEIEPHMKNKFLEYLCEVMFSELERFIGARWFLSKNLKNSV